METNTQEKINLTPEKSGMVEADKTAGGMTQEAYEAKMGNINTLQETVVDKAPEEKKGFFAKLKAGFEKITNSDPIKKAEERLKGNPLLSKEYQRLASTDPVKAEKYKKALGSFTYLAWDESKNDYVDKTKYKNPVGEASNQ